MNPPSSSRIKVRPAAEREGRKDYISIRDFGFWYGEKKALDAISLDIPERQVVAFIGPSGCGKSTLLRNLNRMNDLVDGIRHEGDITINGRSIYDPGLEVISLRRRVGMVFQKSNPFPKSIFENVVYALRVVGVRDRAVLEEACETSLRKAALWDEVKDRLARDLPHWRYEDGWIRRTYKTASWKGTLMVINTVGHLAGPVDR